jgi:hypothetical protein
MQFDLSIVPTVLDLWHVSLGGATLIFALLFLVTFIWGYSNRKVSGSVKPEVKIVEKIVEVEKVIKESQSVQPVILREMSSDAALQLLSILQKEARFLDFVKEDMSAYTDAEIGGAARMVQGGCRKAVEEHFSISPIASQTEGTTVTLEAGFNANHYRMIGNISGSAPFKGTLVHKGWQVSSVNLPKLTESHDMNVIASAEVEL